MKLNLNFDKYKGTTRLKQWWKEVKAHFTQVQEAHNALDTTVSTHKTAAIIDHPDGSVTTEKIADKSITFRKLSLDILKEIAKIPEFLYYEAEPVYLSGCKESLGYELPADIPVNVLFMLENDTDSSLSEFRAHDDYYTQLSCKIPSGETRICILLKRASGGAEPQNGYLFVLDDVDTQKLISKETSERKNADTALGQRITAEADERLAADEALQGDVNTIRSDIVVMSNRFNGKADRVHKHTVEDITDFPQTMTPTLHASTATTYGIGSSSYYGHVKLSDSIGSTSSTGSGVAATPKAVSSAYNAAYNKANIEKNPLATDGDVIYGHLTVGERGGDIGIYSFVTGGFVDDIDNFPNIASGDRSASICGENNTASGYDSAVLGGYNNTASGSCSLVLGGHDNTASGENGISVGGCRNTALAYQTKLGRYSTSGTAGSSSGTAGDVLSVGIGTLSVAKNAFRIDYSGSIYTYKGVNSTGADYAEVWEWLDKNPNNEDRVGRFVAFEGTKIRLATANDPKEILGVISALPSVVGDNFADEWQGIYLKDKFGRLLTEHKTYEAEYDEDGNLIHEAYEADEYIVNPEYDPTLKYIPRLERPEYDAVGTHGKLVVIDDGTCSVGGFCMSSENGIATASEKGFYVMERIDEATVKIYVR